MRGRPISAPKFEPPWCRAEKLAAELNVSLATFRRWMKELGVTPVRHGRGRGFLWYHWGNVHQKMTKAGYTNLPNLPFKPQGGP